MGAREGLLHLRVAEALLKILAWTTPAGVDLDEGLVACRRRLLRLCLQQRRQLAQARCQLNRGEARWLGRGAQSPRMVFGASATTYEHHQAAGEGDTRNHGRSLPLDPGDASPRAAPKSEPAER